MVHGARYETVSCDGQKGKDQGHTGLKIDLEPGLAEASFLTPLGLVVRILCYYHTQHTDTRY